MPIFIFCLILALLIGAVNISFLKASRLHRFLPFLVLTLLVELLAFYLKYYLGQPTGMLYNGYVFVQVVFCTWFFRNVELNPLFRRILDVGLVIYIFASLLTYIFFLPPAQFSNWLFLLGGFLVVLAALLFLFTYFQLDNSQQERFLGPLITIAAGLIAYFSVLSISIAFLDQILIRNY